MSRRRGRSRDNKPIITLGIDIDATALRAAVIQHADGQHTLLDTFTTDSSPNWFDDNGTITNPKGVSNALKSFIRSLGHKPNQTHISVANQPTLLRVLTPPAGVPQNELDTAVKQLILSQLPVTEDSHEIRYAIDGERVLAGTVNKEHAQALMSALNAAGIKPTSIEPRGISALRASRSPTDQPDMLLLINDTSSIITVREQHHLLHHRVSGSGGIDLNQDPAAASRAIISDLHDMAASIITDAPDFTITIAGAEANNNTLRDMLTNEFNRELHSPTLPLGETESEYLTSIGLALKQDTRFNFTPQRTRASRTRATQTQRGAKPRNNLGIILLAPVIAGGLFLYHNSLNSELERLNTEIQEFRTLGLEYTDISRKYDELLARQNRLNNTLRATERITSERVSYANLVNRLINRVTQPVNGTAQAYLTSLEIGAPNNNTPQARVTIPNTQLHGITISGVTRDTDTLSRIVEAFETDSTIEALFDRAALDNDTYTYTLQLLTMSQPDQESIAAAQVARQAQEQLARTQQARREAQDPAEHDTQLIPLAPQAPEQSEAETTQPEQESQAITAAPQAPTEHTDADAQPAPEPETTTDSSFIEEATETPLSTDESSSEELNTPEPAAFEPEPGAYLEAPTDVPVSPFNEDPQ